jgi:outer membrane protein
MRFTFRLALAALTAATALAPAALAAAQEREDLLIVGAGALVYRSPFQGDDAVVTPIPLVIARRGPVYVEGLEFGATWRPTNAQAPLSVDAFLAARALTGEHREKITVDAGVRISWETGVGVLSADYRHDVTGEFDGGEATARFERAFQAGPVTITPGVQVAWQDRAAANHMYGVTAEQRRKMIEDGADVILPVFEVREGGTNVGADLTLLWPVSDRLIAVAQIGALYLGDSARENPGLARDYEAQALVGVGYRF